MNAYSIDLRTKVIEFINSGHKRKEAVEVFGISLRTIDRWFKLLKTKGSLEFKPTPRRPHILDRQKLKEYVDANPSAFIREIAKHFNCSETCVRKALKQMGYTRKKNKKDIWKPMKMQNKHS